MQNHFFPCMFAHKLLHLFHIALSKYKEIRVAWYFMSHSTVWDLPTGWVTAVPLQLTSISPTVTMLLSFVLHDIHWRTTAKRSFCNSYFFYYCNQLEDNTSHKHHCSFSENGKQNKTTFIYFLPRYWTTLIFTCSDEIGLEIILWQYDLHNKEKTEHLLKKKKKQRRRKQENNTWVYPASHRTDQ